MPRLFPSLGRSSKEQTRVYGQYDEYDAPYSQYGYGYEEQEPQNGSAWRKVFPKKSTKRVRLCLLSSLGRRRLTYMTNSKITTDKMRYGRYVLATA